MGIQERYRRHYLLPQVGRAGQERFRRGKVLIVGIGGLGCPAAMELAAAGVGVIGLVDGDVVETTNLQRQTLYTEADIGRAKAEAAAQRLRAMNGACEVRAFPHMLTPENAAEIIQGYDIVVDATDNFEARYLISDTCVRLNKPDVYGAICEFSGQAAILGGEGPCLRCLSDPERESAAPPPAENFGVLAPVPGVIGSLQACEVLKYFAGAGDPLAGSMVFLDMLNMRFDRIVLSKNPGCPLCGEGRGHKWIKS